MQTANYLNKLAKNKYRIKGLLVTRGISMSEIARGLKKTPQAVSAIVRGEKASARIRQEIAIRLGMPVAKLWPTKKRRVSRP